MGGRELFPAHIVCLIATPDFFGLSIPAGVFQHSKTLSIPPFVRFLSARHAKDEVVGALEQCGRGRVLT
jgi:hypothetical protein